jgi:sigma-E factor negative regulatory protein RseC
VIETDGATAQVRAGRHAECENCGACPGSGAAVVSVRNELGARVGQRVLFEIRDENAVKGAFLIFVLPLVAAFAGALLGGLAFSALSLSVLAGRIIGGVLLFAVSVAVVRLADKRYGFRSGVLPSIVKVIG